MPNIPSFFLPFLSLSVADVVLFWQHCGSDELQPSGWSFVFEGGCVNLSVRVANSLASLVFGHWRDMDRRIDGRKAEQASKGWGKMGSFRSLFPFPPPSPTVSTCTLSHGYRVSVRRAKMRILEDKWQCTIYLYKIILFYLSDYKEIRLAKKS